MMRALLASLFVAWAAVSTGAHAVCLDAWRLTGVNMAGAEFNPKRLPGTMNKDYVYPTRTDLAYFAARGANVIRLPVRWERLQRTLMGELDAAETKAIAAVLDAAAAEKMCVIIDIHNYGAYGSEVIGSATVPEEAFIDLWQRVARRFADPNRVALGLMNEPHKLPIATWAEIAQNTVSALRTSGAEHLVIVSGGRWSGVHEWTKTFSGTSNAVAMAPLKDPLGRMLIEMHQYADQYFSGTGLTCHPPERFDNMFRLVSDWARQTGHKLFLGEFGVPAEPNCLAVLEHTLNLISDREVWRGWTYWAAGRWWGSYPLSIQPKSGADAPQMGVVGRFLGR